MESYVLVVGACLLALIVAGLLLWGIIVAGGRLELRERRLVLRRGVLWMGLLLSITGSLAASGLLRNFTALPPPIALVILGVTFVTVCMGFTSVGDLLLRGLSLWTLVGFQVFRLPVEMLLLGLYVDGQIPRRMTFEGANFDVITALGAVGVAALLQQSGGNRKCSGEPTSGSSFVGDPFTQKKAGRGLVWGWNVLGSLLLLNIVTISVLSAPLPVEIFAEGPKNRMIAEFPFVWIPTLFVQAALFGHLLVFRALRAKPTDNQALSNRFLALHEW